MESAQTAPPPPLAGLAGQFLLDPEITFLNHGSFGACPKPVFETYQEWQRKLERDPVDFIGRHVPDLLAEARAATGAFVGAPADKLVFVPNATYGINVVARSLKLQPGDEILTTDHEYGAVNNTWRFNWEARGVRYINRPIPLPLTSPEEFVERLWQGVTPRTRVITLSHITSPTALIFPVELVCRRARQEGILTVIDGAHAPGQIDLNLEAMGVDYYTGNAHKWLCAPKGSAILYAADGHDTLLEPLVVSHGWSSGRSGSRFLDYFSWTGTMDPSAYLSVPAAIHFMQEHNWPAVRAACHQLASETRARINSLTGLDAVAPDSTAWYSQMFTARLPLAAVEGMRDRLWTDFGIEVPVFAWNDQGLIRVSVQAYNTPAHMDHLLDALKTLL
ncbi:MAG: aminotransferase class V-fold PLP-dependent enzyme [Caldilineaceae bacterium]|nr:aminotransferase class V-fold PLP-dependent enzyme [Caldilineaceae bacterium]